MDPILPKFTATVHDSTSSFDWKKTSAFFGLSLVAAVIFVYLSSPMVVTVTGSGEVSVPANNATVSFTLSAVENTSEAAVNSVTAKADSIRNYLTGKGVAEGSIAQSQTTVVPGSLINSSSGGFHASVSMAAKTTNISSISTLISDLYTNGAVVVTQPILSIDNQANIDDEAFKSALKDAKSKARKVGFSNWKFIHKIVGITQASSPTTTTATTKADVLTASDNEAAALNGVFKVVKAVSVTYKMW